MNTESESNVVKIKKSRPVLGFIVFLFLSIAIAVIAFVVYLKSIGYDFSTFSIDNAITYINNVKNEESSESSQISFSQDGSVDCILYKDYIIVLSKDGIKWYSRKGKLLQENSLTMARPVLRSCKKYIAVVDISGRDIYLYKDKKLLWSKKLDNQIVNASINNDGYCTVVTQSKDYKAAVQVIDIYGADKYKKLCADDIVLSAKAIHEGQDILINKVVTNSVKSGTQFEFSNMYDEKPFATIDIADNILPISISYDDNELAAGQSVLLFMDKQGKEVWRKNAESIFCVAPNSEKYIILAGKFTTNANSSKEQVLVLNTEGKEIYSFDQPEKVIGIDLYGNRIALRTQKSIYLYTLSGEKLGQYSARNEIKDAYLISSDEVVIISGGTISTIQIKQ
jgi:hypothetical protein